MQARKETRQFLYKNAGTRSKSRTGDSVNDSQLTQKIQNLYGDGEESFKYTLSQKQTLEEEKPTGLNIAIVPPQFSHLSQSDNFMLKEAKFHSYQRNNNVKNVGSESSDNNLFDPVEPLIDWATTPLFLNVLNSSQEWN